MEDIKKQEDVKVEETKEETVEDTFELPVNGEVHKISTKEAQQLAFLGLQALQAERAKQGKEETVTKTEVKENLEDAVAARVEQLEKKLKETEERLSNKEVNDIRQSIIGKVDVLLESNKLTKEDPELAEMIRTLVYNDIQADPKADINKLFDKRFKKLADKIAKDNKEYIEEKEKDSKSTKKVTSGSTVHEEKKKPDWKAWEKRPRDYGRKLAEKYLSKEV